MKKANFLLIAFCTMLLSAGISAQSKTGVDYFEGKWIVLLKGLPQGDTKMVFVLQKKEGALAGAVLDSTGKEISILDKVEVTDASTTIYFNAQGYDVNLSLTKKDEDHVTGSLMGMFDAEGERVKVQNFNE
jgi:hypothetical protein